LAYRALDMVGVASMTTGGNNRQPVFSGFVLTGVAFIFLAESVLAVDFGEPARVRICVRDEAKRQIAGARITLYHTAHYKDSQEHRGIKATTGREGTAALELQHPDPKSPAGEVWSLRMQVEAEGHAPRHDWLLLLPGAVVEREVSLEPAKTTVIRLRAEDGSPLPGVEFQFSYADLGGSMRSYHAKTDGKGEYAFVHGTLHSWGLTVNAGRRYKRFRDVPHVEMTLSREDLPVSSLDRRLVVKLLGPNGAPAAGWFVAPNPRGSIGGGPIGGEMTSDFAAESLERVGPDGKSVIDRPNEHLAIVSSEGVLFMYPLAPRTWRGTERRLTLRLPPVRRLHTGRVVRKGGAGVANLPLVPGESVRFLGSRNSLGIGQPYFQGPPRIPLSGATASDGTPVGSLFTDAKGHLEVPVYFGVKITWSIVLEERNSWAIDLRSLGAEIHPLESHRRRQLAKNKRITFDFRDERGERIPEMLVSCQGYAGGTHVLNKSGGHYDARGCNVFVDAAVDRLEIKTQARGWRPFEKKLYVSPQDSTVSFTVPDTLRLPPLTGSVFDPDGRPVEGARVGLWQPSPYQAGEPASTGMTTETGADGRFAFKAAPDECTIKLYRFGIPGAPKPLPGWIDGPIEVTPDRRRIDVRLKRSGSVTVLLPGPVPYPDRFYLSGRDKPAADAYPPSYYLHYDQTARTLTAPFVRPGCYMLHASYPGGDYDVLGIAGVAADVGAGEQAVIDLRVGGRYLPRRLPHAWVGVLVTHADQPVSGAVVTLYTMPKKENLAGRPVHRASDLSSDVGRVRFDCVIGTDYLAFARVHGRLVGWTVFRATEGRSIAIEAVAAKTLAVQPEESIYSAQVCVTMPDTGQTEAAAVFTALELYEPHRFTLRDARCAKQEDGQAAGLLQWDGPAGFVAEDLPVGHMFVVEARGRQGGAVLHTREVTLAADGDAVQEIKIGRLSP
jgi:hypothetical protein